MANIFDLINWYLTSFQIMIEGPESRFFDDFQTFQNLRNQIMTTNLWVEQFWFDHKLVSDRLKKNLIGEHKKILNF